MDITDWITSIASLLTSLFTLGVVFQVRELQKQNKNEAINQLYTRMFEIQKLVAEQPDIINHLLGIIDDEKSNIYLEMYADFIEQIVLQVDLLPRHAKKVWRCYVYDTLKKYTKLSDYVKKHLSRKSSHLSVKIDKYITQEKPCYKK